MARLLPLLALGQVAGLLAADAGLLGLRAAQTLACLLLLAAPLLLRRASGRAALAWTAVFASAVGALGGPLEQAQRSSIDRSFETGFEARVCARHQSRHFLHLDLCDVVAVTPASGLPVGRVALIEAWPGPAAAALSELSPGQSIRLRARLRPLEGLRNPGMRDAARAARRRGVGARAVLMDPALLVRRPERDRAPLGLSQLEIGVEALRSRLAERLLASGRGGELLAALALGRGDLLQDPASAAFTELGLRHLLAVSGLHLALLAGLSYALALRAFARIERLARRFDTRGLALATAMLAASGYALLAGFGVPVRRALVFVLAIGLALAAGRRVPASHALAAAALLVLAWDPAALFELGPQLSFAVTAALLLAARRTLAMPRLGGDRPGLALLATLRSLVASSAVAVAISGPILALHGAGSGLAALVFNLIAIPWTACALLPAALLAALSLCIEGPPALRLALAPVVWLAEWLARATLVAAEQTAAAMPDAPLAAPPAPLALLLAGALALACVLVSRVSLRLVCALLVGLALRVGPAQLVLPPPPRIVVLDVGQGDAILVQGREASLLIDGGRALPGRLDLGESAVLPALAALGVRRLDVVAASHADLDHRGGLLAVLRRLEVAELWLPAAGAADPGFAELIELAAERGTRLVTLHGDSRPLIVGDARIVTLWPPASLDGWSRNDRSLVMKIELAGRRLLLTGDLGAAGERALLASGADLSSDWLKLAHHGSASSSSAAFLRAVDPEVALLSAACGARSGLPDEAALARIRRQLPTLWWTGRDGAIVIDLSAAGEAGAAADDVIWSWGTSRSCLPPSTEPPLSALTAGSSR